MSMSGDLPEKFDSAVDGCDCAPCQNARIEQRSTMLSDKKGVITTTWRIVMKKEQKEKAIDAAYEFIEEKNVRGRVQIQDDARVLQAPDVYWVQAWISVDLDTDKS